MSLADIQSMKALKLSKQKATASLGNASNNLNQISLDLGTRPTAINLYNSATSVSGNFVNSVNGTLNTSASYYASDYIPVKALTSYTRIYNVHIAYYDVNKIFLSGSSASGLYFTTPTNCAYIRVSIPTANYASEQIFEVLAPNVKPSIQFQFGKNLFNPNAITQGYFVSEVNGTISANPSYYVTEFIPVTPLTAYAITAPSPHMAFYDANRVYLSGLAPSTQTVIIPNNCYFMRLSFTTGISTSTMQIEEGKVQTPYQPYQLTTNHSMLSTFHDIKLSIPDVIPIVVGKELNIYKTNIMCVDNINNYQVTFSCNVGKHQNERYTYVPVSGDVGDHSMTIYVYQKFNLIAQVNTTIRVIAATKSGTFKTLIIGDSTTANNIMINKLANVLTGDPLTITFIGTQGTSPNFHEGRSGWSTASFYNNSGGVTSPFVFNGSFSFAQYLTTNSFTAPDIVVLNLGINDLTPYFDDTSALSAIYTMISQYDTMIANIKQSNANVKIGIGVTVPSGQQDAFGYSYGAGSLTSWRYNRNNRLLTKVLIDYYGGKQSSNIYLLPLNVNLDTVNNIDLDASAPVNAQNSSITIQRQNNGVHPGTLGYYQIADTYYSWLKSFGA